VGLDLLIPFGVLIALVIYLMFTRTKFEKDIQSLYETKFENLKKQNLPSNKVQFSKKFVGLVFKENYKISIKLFDKSIEDRLKKGKFDIYVRKKNE